MLQLQYLTLFDSNHNAFLNLAASTTAPRNTTEIIQPRGKIQALLTLFGLSKVLRSVAQRESIRLTMFKR